MSYQGQEISNPRTGQRMKFLELAPAELQIETVNPPGGVREPVHVHPRQESGAQVLSGTLIFEVAGDRRTVSPGETITIPANTPHQFWNEGPNDARAIQFFRPALNTAAFFETLFALAQRDQKRSPKLLPLVALVGQFGEEIRPVSPPWPLLRALAAVLGPIARARGHSGRLTAQA